MSKEVAMESWSPTMKIAAGALAALVVMIVIVSRFGRPTDEGLAAPSDSERQPLKQSHRAQQRLEELRAAHARMPQHEGGERLHARSALPGTAGLRDQRARAVGQRPPSTTNDDQEAQDDSNGFDPDPDDVPGLSNVILQDPDPERRLTAVTLLGATEDPQVIPTLAQALSDQDEEVRMAALQSLSDFTDEPPVEAIESALNDPSADIRFEALDVLSDIGGERARSAVIKALNDPDEDVRALAEGILDIDENYEPQTDEPAQPNAAPPAGQPQQPPAAGPAP